jgi:hypothetical protein
MFRAHRAHHRERKIVSIQPLVAVTLCRLPCRLQVGSELTPYTRHGHRERVTATRGYIDTICLSWWWWARCARNMYRVKNKNKHTEKELCLTLVIYQESLNYVQSTKYKIIHTTLNCNCSMYWRKYFRLPSCLQTPYVCYKKYYTPNKLKFQTGNWCKFYESAKKTYL